MMFSKLLIYIVSKGSPLDSPDDITLPGWDLIFPVLSTREREKERERERESARGGLGSARMIHISPLQSEQQNVDTPLK